MRRRTSSFDIKVILIMIIIAAITCSTVMTLLGRRHVSASSAYMNNEITYTTYVVKEGDTIWNIAQDNLTERFPTCKLYTNEVMRVNQMSTALIHPGDLIVIPVEDENPNTYAMAE